MRWSQTFIPTLRDNPADAEAVSHRLLVRAGFIRQLMSGSYSLLPMGLRVVGKISRIVRQEMDAIGGQEFLLPVLHPGEIWQKSGRWETMGDELFRLKDRKSADLCLGMTHEEVFATLAAEIASYRELPQIWYQIQTKLRDEPRPKSGVLRVREFTMKDSYSFDLDWDGLDTAFQKHHRAYSRIFERCGLDSIPVEASSGAMGGNESTEFMVLAEAGEDRIALCRSCGYAANLERATSVVSPVEDGPGPPGPEKFPTPGVRTIEELATFAGGAPADRQIKTLVYVLDGQLGLVLLRGDHALMEQKLQDATGTVEIRPAHPDEVKAAFGALPGSLGAVGVKGHPVRADLALQGRRDMTTGANQDDFHLRGVAMDRDIVVDEWLDLREVTAGEPCPNCSHPLDIRRAIEVGHIFKLGTKYSETLGARVLDESGASRPVVMGSYGIGIERTMAAVVEWSHDETGMVWPMSVAPFEVVVTLLRADDTETAAAGEAVYARLLESGVDVILDDRPERPGVKFTDAELIGFPLRLTIGPRSLQAGVAELTERRSGTTEEVPMSEAAQVVTEAVVAARS